MGLTDVGGRLSYHILDEVARDSPDLLYCIHPRSQGGHHTWRDITFKKLAQAVDLLAWWIDEKLTGKDQKLLAYIGANDLRYAAFMLACMKTGRTVSPSSLIWS